MAWQFIPVGFDTPEEVLELLGAIQIQAQFHLLKKDVWFVGQVEGLGWIFGSYWHPCELVELVVPPCEALAGVALLGPVTLPALEGRQKNVW